MKTKFGRLAAICREEMSANAAYERMDIARLGKVEDNLSAYEALSSLAQRARQREERYRAMAVNIVYRILEPEPKR